MIIASKMAPTGVSPRHQLCTSSGKSGQPLGFVGIFSPNSAPRKWGIILSGSNKMSELTDQVPRRHQISMSQKHLME